MKHSPALGSALAVGHPPQAIGWSAAQSWTVASCVAFTFAMAYAIAVVVFRLPGLDVGSGHLFRIALALHVELAVFFWLMTTAAASWSAGRDGSRLPALLAVACTVIVALAPLAGGSPQMADYFPWLAGNDGFAFGFIGFCIAVLWAAVAGLTARRDGPWFGARRAAWPVLAAAATLLADLANGASGPAELAWGAGHTLLFGHLALMCWEWTRLTGRAAAVAGVAQGWLIAVAAAMPLIPFVFAPGTPLHGEAFTWTMNWLLWPPLLLLGVAIVRDRSQAVARLPRLVFAISFALLVVGCLLGALIAGPTTLVTAHYHAAMGAVAISRMGLIYVEAGTLSIAVPTLRAARLQLIAYSCGLVFLAAGLAVAAVDAAPRKTAATEHRSKGPLYGVGMSISGVGGLLAMLGSSWLVLNLLGRRRERQGAGAGDEGGDA